MKELRTVLLFGSDTIAANIHVEKMPNTIVKKKRLRRNVFKLLNKELLYKMV